jgi:transcriptional regulator of acetoin/glycerol metabolism
MGCLGEIPADNSLPDHVSNEGKKGEEMSIDLFGGKLKEIEKHVIVLCLKCSDGNISKVANAMGINRITLLARMKVLGIPSNVRPSVDEKKEKLRRLEIDSGASKRHNEMQNQKEKTVLYTLEKCNWNRSWAARELGVSVRYIRYTVADLIARGVDIPDGKAGGWRWKFKQDPDVMPFSVAKEIGLPREKRSDAKK